MARDRAILLSPILVGINIVGSSFLWKVVEYPADCRKFAVTLAVFVTVLVGTRHHNLATHWSWHKTGCAAYTGSFPPARRDSNSEGRAKAPHFNRRAPIFKGIERATPWYGYSRLNFFETDCLTAQIICTDLS
jgi:hypothetical protein